MLFHSYEFIFVFLPIVLLGFHFTAALGARAQIAWLVVASVVFYGFWKVSDVTVLLGLMVTTYIFAKLIERYPSRLLLATAVGINLITLGIFKYLGFFSEVFSAATGLDHRIAPLALPLGISFFVFQKIAYLVDTHAGRTIKHGFLDFALFTSFFPQLIAGPIVHQKEVLHQFTNRAAAGLKSQEVAIGITLFTFGLFKKIVLADTFAAVADPGFESATQGVITASSAWTSTLAYTLQLYFDFSAYTDMAIGLAIMFGIRLPINFNSPYKSTSISEFWTRWHITLSRFLRDYVYIPLGGNRKGTARRYTNLLVTMLLGGLWHGASFNFILFGGLHALYLCINEAWRRFGTRFFVIPTIVAWAITFFALMLGLVLFRAPDLPAAGTVYAAMVDFHSLEMPTAPTIALLATGLLIVTLLPNTQQIVALARPTLGKVSVPRGLMAYLLWRPSLGWALASGFLIVSILVVSWPRTTPAPFLYFDF